MKSENNIHTIDATGKRLGKVATQVATILMGKDQANFARHTVADAEVKITNASQLDIPLKHQNEIYQTFSGHPSGRKSVTLERLAKSRGYGEVLRRTVSGMLPDNKLKKKLLAKLTITE